MPWNQKCGAITGLIPVTVGLVLKINDVFVDITI